MFYYKLLLQQLWKSYSLFHSPPSLITFLLFCGTTYNTLSRKEGKEDSKINIITRVFNYRSSLVVFSICWYMKYLFMLLIKFPFSNTVIWIWLVFYKEGCVVSHFATKTTEWNFSSTRPCLVVLFSALCYHLEEILANNFSWLSPSCFDISPLSKKYVPLLNNFSIIFIMY